MAEDKPKVSDEKKGPGPKSEDTTREDTVTSPGLVAGADRALQDARQNQFGDITSSTGGANTPGQHGRDGGEINEQPNNPAPSDAAIAGEVAPVSSAEVEPAPAEEPTAETPVKKL